MKIKEVKTKSFATAGFEIGKEIVRSVIKPQFFPKESTEDDEIIDISKGNVNAVEFNAQQLQTISSIAPLVGNAMYHRTNEALELERLRIVRVLASMSESNEEFVEVFKELNFKLSLRE